MHYPSFDVWFELLKDDAARKGLTRGIENMTTRALQLFYNDGVEASIEGILEGKKPAGSQHNFRPQRSA